MNKIETLHQKREPQFPRVEVPLTEAEQAELDAFKAEAKWKKNTQIAFLAALFRKGKPFTGVSKPRRKPTKHQRGIANARARSGYLKSVA
jgi:hypothetical protein